jgi:hypothetical protein
VKPRKHSSNNKLRKSNVLNKKLITRAQQNVSTAAAQTKNCENPRGKTDSATPTTNCASPTFNKKASHASSTKHFPCRRSNKELRRPSRQLRKRNSNKKLRKPGRCVRAPRLQVTSHEGNFLSGWQGSDLPTPLGKADLASKVLFRWSENDFKASFSRGEAYGVFASRSPLGKSQT